MGSGAHQSSRCKQPVGRCRTSWICRHAASTRTTEAPGAGHLAGKCLHISMLFCEQCCGMCCSNSSAALLAECHVTVLTAVAVHACYSDISSWLHASHTGPAEPWTACTPSFHLPYNESSFSRQSAVVHALAQLTFHMAWLAGETDSVPCSRTPPHPQHHS